MVAVVFVESKHILPKDIINAADEYSFARLLMAKGEKNATEKVISSMYKDNMQFKREEDLSGFHKIDPPLLWFLNTVGCCRRLVLASFADDSAFRSHALDISCCDNYLYSSYEGANGGNDSGVPDWELHDVTVRHSLHYLETNEWHKHQERIAIAKKIDIYTARFELKESEKVYGYSSASQASTTTERVANFKQKTADCEKACKKALNKFAINTWPYGMDNIMFLYKWRAKLAKRIFFITLSIDLIKVLKTDCNLMALGIQKKILLILGVILLTIEKEDRQREIDIYQNLVSVGGENENMPQQNNPRRCK